MSNNINPYLFRLSINRNWKSIWYSEKKNYFKNLKEDIKLRFKLKNYLYKFFITKIIINKSNLNFIIYVYIKKKNLYKFYKNQYSLICSKIYKFLNKKFILIIKNERNILSNPIIIFIKILEKIKKRKNYKNVIKDVIRESSKKGSFGFKIQIKGRINGSSMSKTQVYKLGKIPLSSISANIRYYSNFCKTNYGIIGIKIWIYLGNFFYLY